MRLLRTVDELLEIQLSSMQGNKTDAYMRGMYNGMETIRSVIAKEEPIFIEKNCELDQAAVDRHPERYI